MRRRTIYLLLIAALALAVALLVVLIPNLDQRQNPKYLTIGSLAPNGELILTNGTVRDISYFRGEPVLIWFVATWCPSCAVGVYTLNNTISFFIDHHVTVIIVQLYNNLGYSGPNIIQFILESGGEYAYEHGYIIPAVSTYKLTKTYDPWGYPDIYYLINSNGKIVYINSEPTVTLHQLMGAVLSIAPGSS